MAEHAPLPVSGYVPQNQENIDLVNEGKLLEEQVLRYLDKVGAHNSVQFANTPKQGESARFSAIGKTNIQLGFMSVFRSIMMPGRLVLAGDKPDSEK